MGKGDLNKHTYNKHLVWDNDQEQGHSGNEGLAWAIVQRTKCPKSPNLKFGRIQHLEHIVVIEFYKKGNTLSISEVSFEGKNFNENKDT
jgi:hypothetical protein